jgi:uncharacterized cupredoxin-like copper-binding protein
MSKQTISITLLLILALSLVLSACQQDAQAEQLNEAAFVARDYSFSGPDSIAAGWTRLILSNEGPDYHHMQLVRLSDGKTVDDLVAAFNDSPVLPDWAEEVGGPNPPEAGQGSEAIVNLEAGNYALICTVPDRQGVPHIQHGMVKALTVEAVAEDTAVEPVADVTLDMVDFSFVLSAPLQTGEQTIRVNNAGTQGHEVFLARLAPERSMDDFLASFAPDAAFDAPVWQAMGGLSVIEPNAYGYFTVDLEPGQYVLACFAPDDNSGMPHLMMGMVQEITVK